jgi:hypothetical protein
MVIDVEGQLQEGCEMTDTAELIARGTAMITEYDSDLIAANMFNELVTALAAQAQEIERLKEYALVANRNGERLEQRAEAAEARVRELKDEIDRLQTVICCEQDRGDAIEAATIERCAAIVGDHRVAARIRALVKS